MLASQLNKCPVQVITANRSKVKKHPVEDSPENSVERFLFSYC